IGHVLIARSDAPRSLMFHFFHEQKDFESLQVERHYQPYVLHSCDVIGVGESFFLKPALLEICLITYLNESTLIRLLGLRSVTNKQSSSSLRFSRYLFNQILQRILK